MQDLMATIALENGATFFFFSNTGGGNNNTIKQRRKNRLACGGPISNMVERLNPVSDLSWPYHLRSISVLPHYAPDRLRDEGSLQEIKFAMTDGVTPGAGIKVI